MNSKQNAAHGTWHSPITIEHVVGKAVALHAPTVDGSDVLWVESRPAECGRSVLVRRGPDGNITDITPPPFDVGSTVHGYGGASFAASGGCVVFSHKTDGSVWRMERDEAPQRIAGATGCHFVDFSFLPTNDGGSPRWVLAIREDHRRSETEPRAAIVALCLTESTAEPVGRVLVEGPDFLSSPRPSPDGKFLAWISWNHPDMPWDATQLMRASFRQGGSSDQVPTLKTIEQLLGQQRESVIQPGWTVKNELLACSDRSSWWNLYRIDGIEAITPLCPKEAEIGEPHWVFGDRSWWPLPDGNIVAVAISDGRRTPGLIADGAWTVLSLGGRSEPRVRACPIPVAENHWIWLKAERDAPPAIMLDDTALRKSSAQEFISAALSFAEPMIFSADDGDMVHAFFYRPVNTDFESPFSQLPPLIVISHGGPTSMSDDALSIPVQWWTSRGFAVADVNYGGSSGYGRAYRERLSGKWGIVDVADCATVAQGLAKKGWVDGSRMAIRGASAGGYTTLAALTFTNVFQAGASLFGISDLRLLAGSTHKFESRYLDKLVGPLPESTAVYDARSPVKHAERLNCPIIFFHGLNDEAVPPKQAQIMAAALRESGLKCALYLFEGEGHGFRQADTIRRVLELELDFYGRVFGFIPTDIQEQVLLT